MATSEGETMDISQSEGYLYEQDRKKFKPLKAIRRMFRGRKKSKELSRSLGSILPSASAPESGTSAHAFVRSLSHESVFAKEGIISPSPGGAEFRHALSVDNITAVTVPLDRLQDEPDAAKSMSIGSDVNRSDRDLKTNGNDLDLNMNDLPVNVQRLDNKAAYDKIALRPKRRPARNARGAQQQHVIRVQAQVNGFAEEDSPARDEDLKDAAGDESPPRAKKARPPSFLPATQENEKRNSGETVAAAPKRLSMLGRSPVGGGPGMIVPSLEDVQNIKLRKRQTNGESKEPEKAPEKPFAVKSKSFTSSGTEKSEKPKITKKPLSTSKKPPKEEQKGGTDGGSSFFPWKNKSAGPKSATVKQSEDGSKENEKPKSMFPGRKANKKSATEKESKVSAAARFFSSSDKKESAKKKGADLGKQEKNHSGNNSKDAEPATMDVTEERAQSPQEVIPPKGESAVNTPSESSEGRTKNDKTGEKSLLEQMTAEWSQRESKFSSPKRESGSSKYAEKLKLETEKLAEDKKSTPLSLKSPSDPQKYMSEKKPVGEKKMEPDTEAKSRETIILKDDHEKKGNDEKTEAVSPVDEEQKSFSLSLKKFAFAVGATDSVTRKTVESGSVPESKTSPTRVVADTSQVAQEKDHNLKTILQPTSPVERSESDEYKLSGENKLQTGPPTLETKRVHSPTGKEKERVKTPGQENAHKIPIENTPAHQGVMKSVVSSSSPPAVVAELGRSQSENKTVKTPGSTTAQETTKAVSPVQQSIPQPDIREKNVTQYAEKKTPETSASNEKTASNERKEAKLQTTNKSRSLERDDIPATSEGQNKNDVIKPRHRFRSASERGAGDVAPAEIYSRNKLKPIGDNLTSKRSASVKINPSINSPTRALRPKSFNVKSTQSNEETSSLKDVDKPALLPEKTKITSPSPKPSPIKEKPKVAEKPKSPLKTPIRTPNIKTLMQDAENNNVKASEVLKEPDRKPTTPVDPTSPRKQSSKPGKEDEDKDKDVPAWVKMARRRSKVWEEGGLKSQKPASPRTPSAEAVSVTDDRPKTLHVVKPRADSKEKIQTYAATPAKGSPRTPSSRTAPIPNISMISPRKTNPSPKEATPSGQPSWLAIAMQKQKSWAKEETV